jgi:hypothetical protein
MREHQQRSKRTPQERPRLHTSKTTGSVGKKKVWFLFCLYLGARTT